MEENEVSDLEEKLKEAEQAIQDTFKSGRFPTSEKYIEIDQIKAKLETARRVKTMDTKRIEPKLTRKVTIMISENEFQELTKKAKSMDLDLSKCIRHLLTSTHQSGDSALK